MHTILALRRQSKRITSSRQVWAIEREHVSINIQINNFFEK
jgi:hypothetical protein